MGMMQDRGADKNWTNLSYNNVLGTLIVNDKSVSGPYFTIIEAVKAEVGEEQWKKGYEMNAKARSLYEAKIKEHNAGLAPGETPVMNGIKIVGTLDSVKSKVLSSKDGSVNNNVFEVVIGDGADAYSISFQTAQATDLIARLCSGNVKLGDEVQISVKSRISEANNRKYTNINTYISPVLTDANGKKTVGKTIQGVEGFYQEVMNARKAALKGTAYENYDDSWSANKKQARRNIADDATEEFLKARLMESGLVRSREDSDKNAETPAQEQDYGMSDDPDLVPDASASMDDDIPF